MNSQKSRSIDAVRKPNQTSKLLFGLGSVIQLMRFGIAIAMLLYAGSETLSASSSAHWPTTTGKVIEKKIEIHKSLKAFQPDSHEAKVTYRYKVGDKEYEANRIKFGGVGSDNAEKTLDKYNSPTVSVHYDPKNPGEACLDANANYSAIGLSCVMAVFLFMLMIFDPK